MNEATVGTPPLGEPRIADKVAAFLELDSVFFLLVDPFCFLSTVETLFRALFYGRVVLFWLFVEEALLVLAAGLSFDSDIDF